MVGRVAVSRVTTINLLLLENYLLPAIIKQGGGVDGQSSVGKILDY